MRNYRLAYIIGSLIKHVREFRIGLSIFKYKEAGCYWAAIAWFAQAGYNRTTQRSTVLIIIE